MDADVAARVERVLRGGTSVGAPGAGSGGGGDFVPSPFAPVVVPRASEAKSKSEGTGRGVSPAVLWIALLVVFGGALLAVAYVLAKRHSPDAVRRSRDRLYDRIAAADPVPAPATAAPGSVRSEPLPGVDAALNSAPAGADAEASRQRELELAAAEGEYTPLP